MKLKWLQIILSLSILIIALVFGGFGLFYLNIKDDLHKIDAAFLQKALYLNDQAEVKINKVYRIEFEQGALIRQDQWDHFNLLFDAQLPLEYKILAGHSSESSNGRTQILEILSDISYEGFIQNDCELINCLQRKMSFPDLPSVLWKGLMGIEDIRFLDHSGVDYISLLRALWKDILALKIVQGGSTLTQQLVKNLFLTTDKNLVRKLKEIFYATYIESRFTKEQIIEVYFNEINWGVFQNLNIKGIKMASLAYFNKPPAELNSFEVSILISMLKGPNYYHPLKNLEKLKERTNFVYQKLVESHFIANNPQEFWNNDAWGSWQKKLTKYNQLSFLRTAYDLSRQQLNPHLSLNPYEQFIILENFYEFSQKYHDILKGKDFAFKLLFLPDVNTELKGLTSTLSFYSKSERNDDHALMQEVHQVGSILKPIIYETFLELGADTSDMVSTKAVSEKLRSGLWTPKESHKNIDDEVTLVDALQLSLNRPLIHLAQKYGYPELETLLKEKIPQLKLPLNEYPSQLLGSMEVSLWNVLKIYKNFLINYCDEGKSSVKEIIEILRESEKTTIGSVLNPLYANLKLFGKTGTTNLGRDNWFIGFDGKGLYVLWFGLESDKEQQGLKLSGARSSFKLFQDYYLFRGKRALDLTCYSD